MTTKRLTMPKLPEWAQVTDKRRAHIDRVVALLATWAKRMGLADDEASRWLAAGVLHDALRDAPDQMLRALTGDGSKLVAAIAPPVIAAKDADEDHPGMSCHAVDPEVDGHRMAQIAQCGQPHRRQALRVRLPRRRQSGEIAVGEGQRHDIRRRLPEIDRLGSRRRAGTGVLTSEPGTAAAISPAPVTVSNHVDSRTAPTT